MNNFKYDNFIGKLVIFSNPSTTFDDLNGKIGIIIKIGTCKTWSTAKSYKLEPCYKILPLNFEVRPHFFGSFPSRICSKDWNDDGHFLGSCWKLL